MQPTTAALEAELAAIADPRAEALRAVALIAEHGLDAARAVVGEYHLQGQVWAVDEAPADCPWELEGCRSVAEAVDRIWAGLPPEAAPFVSALRKSCHYIVIRRADWGEWSLIYVLLHDRPDSLASKSPAAHGYRTVCFGGPPCPSPELSDEAAAAGWVLPPDLLRFYAIHDGFGFGSPPGGTESVVNSGNLDPLNATTPDRLELMCDGGGHRRLLIRDPTRPEARPLVWDWDRDTWELSAPRTLAQFLAGELAAKVLGIDPYASDWPMPMTPAEPPGSGS